MNAPQLSPRELEALRHIASGNSRKQVAQLMGLSEYTVADRTSAVRLKLKARSNAQAVAVAARMGLL